MEERNKRKENGEDVVIYRGKVVTRESLEASKAAASGAAGGGN